MAQDLILCHDLALGDVVALTALARDISLCYPGRFNLHMQTSFRHAVWVNSPYVSTHPPRHQGVFSMRCHYGPQMKEAKHGKFIHFTEGFIDDFNRVAGRKFGIEVRLTKKKPDLHLSAAETATAPFGLESGKYWVMVAGGKSDMTTKWWDALRYQEVVNKLAGEVQFVQCGNARHYHPKLQGVINKVGCTNPRDFVHLIAHSAGVVSPITAAMHIAAAFDKPAVVIAGGREAWWWEAYDRHILLHTLGQMHCCKDTACYMSTTTQASNCPCQDPLPPGTAGNVTPVARCMHLITSDMVVNAVRTLRDADPAASFIEVTRKPVISEFINSPVVGPRHAAGAGVTVVKPDLTPSIVEASCQVLGRLKENPVTKPLTVLGPKFTLCTAFYGGAVGNETYDDKGVKKYFQDLHLRFLDTLIQSVDLRNVDLRVGLNGVGAGVLHLLDAIKSLSSVTLVGPNENKMKYPRMRDIFYDATAPITTKWVAWFDDDVVFKPQWVSTAESTIARVADDPAVKCFGAHYHFCLSPATFRWHTQRPWWRNRPLPAKMRRPRVDFCLGGAWLMPYADIVALDWPDLGLGHNGGDVALGNALYQRGWKICNLGDFVDQLNTSRRGINTAHPTA